MTRAGFLSSYSHFTDTSPILRGAFINVYMHRRQSRSAHRRGDRASSAAGQLQDEPREGHRAGEHVAHLHGVPHQHHQSSRLRARELRRHRQVADGRSARGTDRPVGDRQFRQRQRPADQLCPAADAADRPGPGGAEQLRAVLGRLRLRAGFKPERSMCRRPGQRQVDPGRLRHSRLSSPISPKQTPSVCESAPLPEAKRSAERDHANAPTNVPPRPWRSGCRRAVPQLCLGARCEGTSTPRGRNS